MHRAASSIHPGPSNLLPDGSLIVQKEIQFAHHCGFSPRDAPARQFHVHMDQVDDIRTARELNRHSGPRHAGSPKNAFKVRQDHSQIIPRCPFDNCSDKRYAEKKSADHPFQNALLFSAAHAGTVR
jgi:hypothetical protein